MSSVRLWQNEKKKINFNPLPLRLSFKPVYVDCRSSTDTALPRNLSPVTVKRLPIPRQPRSLLETREQERTTASRRGTVFNFSFGFFLYWSEKESIRKHKMYMVGDVSRIHKSEAGGANKIFFIPSKLFFKFHFQLKSIFSYLFRSRREIRWCYKVENGAVLSAGSRGSRCANILSRGSVVCSGHNPTDVKAKISVRHKPIGTSDLLFVLTSGRREIVAGKDDAGGNARGRGDG